MANAPTHAVIRVRDLVVDFETHRVLNGVNVELFRGEILGFVGASGAGKSTLARTIIGLLPKRAGVIEVLGVDLDKANYAQRQTVDLRWGILFQQGALFSSLTVGKNVEFPMREYLRLSNRVATEMAIGKLEMVGLSPDVYRRMCDGDPALGVRSERYAVEGNGYNSRKIATFRLVGGSQLKPDPLNARGCRHCRPAIRC